MKELNVTECKKVNGGGQFGWNEGKAAIMVLAAAGLAIGTGGTGLFGLAVWAGMEIAD